VTRRELNKSSLIYSLILSSLPEMEGLLKLLLNFLRPNAIKNCQNSKDIGIFIKRREKEQILKIHILVVRAFLIKNMGLTRFINKIKFMTS